MLDFSDWLSLYCPEAVYFASVGTAPWKGKGMAGKATKILIINSCCTLPKYCFYNMGLLFVTTIE